MSKMKTLRRVLIVAFSFMASILFTFAITSLTKAPTNAFAEDEIAYTDLFSNNSADLTVGLKMVGETDAVSDGLLFSTPKGENGAWHANDNRKQWSTSLNAEFNRTDTVKLTMLFDQHPGLGDRVRQFGMFIIRVTNTSDATDYFDIVYKNDTLYGDRVGCHVYYKGNPRNHYNLREGGHEDVYGYRTKPDFKMKVGDVTLSPYTANGKNYILVGTYRTYDSGETEGYNIWAPGFEKYTLSFISSIDGSMYNGYASNDPVNSIALNLKSISCTPDGGEATVIDFTGVSDTASKITKPAFFKDNTAANPAEGATAVSDLFKFGENKDGKVFGKVSQYALGGIRLGDLYRSQYSTSYIYWEEEAWNAELDGTFTNFNMEFKFPTLISSWRTASYKSSAGNDVQTSTKPYEGKFTIKLLDMVNPTTDYVEITYLGTREEVDGVKNDLTEVQIVAYKGGVEVYNNADALLGSAVPTLGQLYNGKGDVTRLFDRFATIDARQDGANFVITVPTHKEATNSTATEFGTPHTVSLENFAFENGFTVAFDSGVNRDRNNEYYNGTPVAINSINGVYLGDLDGLNPQYVSISENYSDVKVVGDLNVSIYEDETYTDQGAIWFKELGNGWGYPETKMGTGTIGNVAGQTYQLNYGKDINGDDLVRTITVKSLSELINEANFKVKGASMRLYEEGFAGVEELGLRIHVVLHSSVYNRILSYANATDGYSVTLGTLVAPKSAVIGGSIGMADWKENATVIKNVLTYGAGANEWHTLYEVDVNGIEQDTGYMEAYIWYTDIAGTGVDAYTAEYVAWGYAEIGTESNKFVKYAVPSAGGDHTYSLRYVAEYAQDAYVAEYGLAGVSMSRKIKLVDWITYLNKFAETPATIG